jgi:hypothetical protein
MWRRKSNPKGIRGLFFFSFGHTFLPIFSFRKKRLNKRNTKEEKKSVEKIKEKLKMIARSSIGIVFICLAVITAGCARIAKHGDEISVQQVTKIESILANSANYEGKTVKVEGKIINECPSGCWIDLKGETGVIHVTLTTFAIPQEVGKTAVVEGNVLNEVGRLTIVGKGVEIK